MQWDGWVPERKILAATIDALRANIAVLDRAGVIIAVNDKWRLFGAQRNALFDSVGINYLDVCSRAAEQGDASARRVEAGLRRVLAGETEACGHAYKIDDRVYRMSGRRLGDPLGGVIVAHEDITALLLARQDRAQLRRSLDTARREHLAQSSRTYEELGQRLAAISLAALTLEGGGDATNAIALIKMAVDEARNELRAMRYQDEARLTN